MGSRGQLLKKKKKICKNKQNTKWWDNLRDIPSKQTNQQTLTTVLALIIN